MAIFYIGGMKNMVLRIYKVNTDLPYEQIREELECSRIWDIDASNYKFDRSEIVNYTKVEDLIEAIENNELDLNLNQSDIIEMLPDSRQLNDSQLMRDMDIENSLNFLIQTSLGIERIALEKKYLCQELTFKSLKAQLA